MDGTFRLRLPILFFLSDSHAAFFFLLVISLINSPKLQVWDTTLILFYSKLYCSHFSFVIQTGGIFFLCHHSGIGQCLVFLGFLTLLENFGLVTPIPDGIRVLGVETPLRT